MNRIKSAWVAVKESYRDLNDDLQFPFINMYTLLVFGYLMSVFGRIAPIVHDAFGVTNAFAEVGLNVGMILIVLVITSVVYYLTNKAFWKRHQDEICDHDEDGYENA